MADLFPLLLLLSLGLMAVGVLNPTFFNGLIENPTRRKNTVVFGFFTILLFTLTGITTPANQTRGSVEGKIVTIPPSTPTPTIVPTDTPTPTIKIVTPTPTPIVYETSSNSGLSNDNYYTNSAGNEVHSPAYSDSVPAGASAICGDGTYSFSQHRSGTCSHHGGVSEWL
jgi:hypothetical protein